MSRSRRAAGLAALLLCALAAPGCQGERPPVARLAVEPNEAELPYPETRDLDLLFEPAVPRSELGEQPTVFVHLVDSLGTVLRTFDHPLPDGWEPGRPLAYRMRLSQSALAESLPAGEHDLALGLYDAASGRRHPLSGAGRPIAEAEYAVARLRVPEPGGPLPRFEYSPEWLPAEASGDRQVVAMRWLGAETGSLRASQLAPGGRLQIELHLPPGPPPDSHFVTTPDRRGPVVEVRSTCEPEEVVISGPGRHFAEWAVPAGAEACDLALTANFLFERERAEVRHSLRLELVAWQPAAARR